jgi:hypothetical protein
MDLAEVCPEQTFFKELLHLGIYKPAVLFDIAWKIEVSHTESLKKTGNTCSS